jgi:8-oxo-dGTP pyrophosphatase MutT (NUDIX family)
MNMETDESGMRVGLPLERVVGALLRNDNRVLLCLRSLEREHYPGVWDVPGGHIDRHEQKRHFRAMVID